MQFLQDLSIRIKVLIPPAIFIGALAIVAWLGIYGMTQQHATLGAVNEIALTKIRAVDDFIILSEQVQSDVFQIYVLHSMKLPQSEVQPINMRLQQGLSDLNIAHGEMLTHWQPDSAERAILERMKPPMDAFRLQAQQAAVTVADNPSFGVLLVRSSGVSFAEFRKTLVELQDYQKAKVVRLAGEMEQSTRTLASVIIVFAFLITLGALVVTTQMSTRLISQPIRSITQVMRQLASGDLSVKVGDLNRRDEIGAMAKAVEVFRNNALEKVRLDKELHASEDRFRLLFTQMLEGFALHEIICDDKGNPVDYRFIEANQAFEKLTGLPAREIIGKTIRQVLPDTEQDSIDKYGQVALTGQSIVFERYARELDRHYTVHAYCPQRGQFAVISEDITERKRQETQILAARAALQRLLAEADQSRRALLSVVEDQKIAEEQINKLNAELEQRIIERTAQLQAANKELEAFAYSVSHDLRSPLRAVDGFSRILLEEYEDKLDAEGKRLLNVVRTNTQRMDQLITDLLTLSRITRGEMQFSRIDMTALVHTVYHEIASSETQGAISFSVAHLPDAFGDPTLLRQAWSNLLSNATKYTMPKTERRIEIGSYAEDGMNVYFVKDNGVGFDPAYTHKLFGVFQRLHTTAEFEGNGVGLAIVQRIIHRHGGRVWAEGQVNQGATFYFALPQK
ncbi:MAG: ATP-binding protein [Anaerolineae bacterium]